MDRVLKWVDRFEEKPLPITVSNAKRALPKTSFNKFLELTGYVPAVNVKKSERRIFLETIRLNESTPVVDLKSDYNLTYRMQNDGYMFYINDKKHITRIR